MLNKDLPVAILWQFIKWLTLGVLTELEKSTDLCISDVTSPSNPGRS